MITWPSTGRKPRQSIKCPEITKSDFVLIYKSKRDRAMPDEQNTMSKRPQSLITARGTSSANSLVYGFLGHLRQLAKTLTVNSVLLLIVCFVVVVFCLFVWFRFFALSDNSCSVDLTSKSTHHYRNQFLTAVLRSYSTTFPSRLSTTSDPPPPPPSISMLLGGTCALGKVHERGTPSVISFPSVTFETVPVLVSLMMTLSRPFK